MTIKETKSTKVEKLMEKVIDLSAECKEREEKETTFSKNLAGQWKAIFEVFIHTSSYASGESRVYEKDN